MTIKDHAIYLMKLSITVSCACSCGHILLNGWDFYLEEITNIILYKKGTLIGLVVGAATPSAAGAGAVATALGSTAATTATGAIAATGGAASCGIIEDAALVVGAIFTAISFLP